jgi:hypothetical protein
MRRDTLMPFRHVRGSFSESNTACSEINTVAHLNFHGFCHSFGNGTGRFDRRAMDAAGICPCRKAEPNGSGRIVAGRPFSIGDHDVLNRLGT